MANRRMFSRTVIQNDKFLDMPFSAQALYAQLSISADDDGFVVSPKAIQRLTGAVEEDLNTLVQNGYLIRFSNGAVVIVHWKINNEIKADRYKETDCKKEKAMLGINEEKEYFMLDMQLDSKLSPTCIQFGSSLEPQDKLSKDKLGEVKVGEVKKEEGEGRVRGRGVGETLEKPTLAESERLGILTKSGKMHIFTQNEIDTIESEKPGIDLGVELGRLNSLLDIVGATTRPEEEAAMQFVIDHVNL